MRFSKPSLPSLRTSESGSSPSGRNRKYAWRPSRRRGRADSSAFHAAARPARSPSPQNTTSGAARHSTSVCSGVVAVPSDRKSVVGGKRVEVRVDLGGRRLHQKKKQKTT